MSNETATLSQNIGFTHEDFAALLDEYDYHFSPGDIVAGTVFSMEQKGALIDIGAKTAAFIPVQELSINRVEDAHEVLQAEETREFFILTDENEDGQLTLSIRRIEYMRAWERVRQLKEEDATVYSNVFATNRGGALVRVEGLRGFIPGSHISVKDTKDDLVGEDLPLKFLEVDEERNRLVLSHRRALVERKMNGLEKGQVVIGSVRGIKPYGAFIDIGGVSGLLHISEISHDHIDTPHSVFNVNDELKVMIIELDADRGRISLSTKQLEPEAGDMLKNREIVFEKAEEMAAKFREKLLSGDSDNPEAAKEVVQEETVQEANPEVVNEANTDVSEINEANTDVSEINEANTDVSEINEANTDVSETVLETETVTAEVESDSATTEEITEEAETTTTAEEETETDSEEEEVTATVA